MSPERATALRRPFADNSSSGSSHLSPMCAPSSTSRRRGAGGGGQGLTKAKMVECQWLAPVLVGQFEFVEWTPDNHLRHSRFIALREDKNAQSVSRE